MWQKTRGRIALHPPLLTADTFTTVGSTYVIITLDKHDLGGFETSLKPYTLSCQLSGIVLGETNIFPSLNPLSDCAAESRLVVYIRTPYGGIGGYLLL